MARGYISAQDRKGLRREVNFGCPVQGCGSPYLSYHHFDPPVAEGGGGDPAGIIALCLPHHKQADIGTWTNDQLREMKQNPYLRRPEARGRVEWLRHEVVFRMGGVTALKAEVLLQAKDRRLIWVERDPTGYLLLNIDLPGSDGISILQMEHNDWVVTGDLDDLEVIPSGRHILVSAPHRGLEIFVRFMDLEETLFHKEVEASARRSWEFSQMMLERFSPRLTDKLREELARSMYTPERLAEAEWTRIKDTVKNWPALEVTIEGHLPWPKPIDISPGLTNLAGAYLSGVTTIGGIAINIG